MRNILVKELKKLSDNSLRFAGQKTFVIGLTNKPVKRISKGENFLLKPKTAVTRLILKTAIWTNRIV